MERKITNVLLSLILSYSYTAPYQYYIYLLRVGLTCKRLYKLANSPAWWEKLNLASAPFDEKIILQIILPRKGFIKELYLYETSVKNPLYFIGGCPNLKLLDISDCCFVKSKTEIQIQSQEKGGHQQVTEKGPAVNMVQTLFTGHNKTNEKNPAMDALLATAATIDGGLKAMTPNWLPIEWESHLPFFKKISNSSLSDLYLLRSSIYPEQLETLLKYTPNLVRLHIGGGGSFSGTKYARYIPHLKLLDCSQYQTPNPSNLEEFKNLSCVLCNVPSLITKPPKKTKICHSLSALLEPLFGQKISRGQVQEILTTARGLIDLGAEQCVRTLTGNGSLLGKIIQSPHNIPWDFVEFFLSGGKNGNHWRRRKLLDAQLWTDKKTATKGNVLMEIIDNPNKFSPNELLNCVTLLILYGVNVNTRMGVEDDFYESTLGPLSLAFEKRQWGVIRFIIFNGNLFNPTLEALMLLDKAIEINLWDLGEGGATVEHLINNFKKSGSDIAISKNHLALLFRNVIQKNADFRFVEFLLKFDFPLNSLVLDENKTHRHTLLHYAISIKPDNCLQIVEALLKSKADPNFCAPLDEPPIFLIVGVSSNGENSLEILKKFLEASSVDLSVKNRVGRTLVSESIFNGSIEIATFLIEKRLHLLLEDDNLIEGIILSPHFSPEFQLPMIKEIISSGYKSKKKMEFTLLVVHMKSVEVAVFCVEHGLCKVPVEPIGNVKEFFRIIADDKSGWVKTLDKGLHIANKMVVNKEGDGILHWSMKFCVDKESLLTILDYAKDHIHQPNDNNYTPLIVGCKHGNLTAVRCLIQKNVEERDLFFLEKDENGDSPLHIAVKMGYFPLVDLLVEYDHPTDIKNNLGEMPMDLCRHDTKTWTILNKARKW